MTDVVHPIYGSREDLVKMPFDMRIWAYLLHIHSTPDITFPRNGKVWHYTNASGLQGIISTNRFWSSDIRYMNDPTEMKFLGSVFAEEVIKQHGGFDRDESNLFVQVLSLIEGIKTIPASRDPKTMFFASSFCLKSDLLSQWRGYGNFGAGYALGFDLAQFQPDVQMGYLIKMSYDRSKAAQVCREIISIYRESLKVIGGLKDELPEWCYSAVTFAATGFKDPSYEEEQEVRILVRQGEKIGLKGPTEFEIKYRTRGDDLLPYVDEGLHIRTDDRVVPKLPLTDLIVGPGIKPDRAIRTLRRFVELSGFNGVDVRPSAIPFAG